MTDCTAIVICMDRKYAAKWPQSVQRRWTTLGGAWQQLYEIWLARTEPYLLLVADTAERQRYGAPLIQMLDNRAALRSAVQHVCLDLKGQRCKWLLLMKPDTKARLIVEVELQIDFAAGVTA